MSYDELHAVAQGRVWTGEQALERKLIDELGGLEAAIRKAAELANLETYGYSVYPERKSFIEKLLEETDPEAVIELPSKELQQQLEQILLLQQMTTHSPSIAMLPYQIRFE